MKIRLLTTSIVVAAGSLLAFAPHAGGGGGHAESPAPAPAAQAPSTVKMGAKKAPAPATPAPAPAAQPAAPSDGHAAANSPASVANKPETEAPSAEAALNWLLEGNARFVSGNNQNPNSDPSRVSEVAAGQHPFATILSCADSRVPVERVFDRGVGDLFVIRVAGNVAGVSETGTIEYGTGHLHTPLLVVMGHTACGAVNAAASGAELHGAVAKLVDHIRPSVDAVRQQYPELKPDQITPIAVRLNVWESIKDLLTESPEIRDLTAEGKLKVVGAVYDLNSGKVHFLGEHPQQPQFLSGGTAAASADASSAPKSASKPAPKSATSHADADNDEKHH